MFHKAGHPCGARAAIILIWIIGMLGGQPAHSVLADTLTVTNTSDSGSGSLRAVIQSASAGDIISFDSSLAGGTITLTSQLTINKNLTIDASGLSSPLTLSGGNITRIMDIVYPADVAISGLTLTAGAADGNGGAVHATGRFTATNSAFLDNTATQDGGAIWGGQILLTNTTLSGNTAGGNGGAIHGVQMTLKNTTIDNNLASYEGGAFALAGNSESTIVNSTITQNQAGDSGGAFFTMGVTIMEIYNSTFAQNFAIMGHEFYLTGVNMVTLSNTIFVCTAGSDDCYIQLGNTTVHPDNSTLAVGSLLEYGLAELADNGGPTKTMSLLPGSILIDFGEDAACASAPVNNLDQRGVTRPQGSHCDIGAFEAAPSLIVTNTADGGPGSLRQAVLDSEEGATITFAPYLAGQVIPFNSSLIIDKDLTIDGSALNPPLTLLGGPHTRIMEVKYPAKVTISGLVLTGATANSGNGGAVYVESEFTAINSTFYNNKAINGGAIWGGRVTLIDSTLTQNIAAYDGGAVGGVILAIRNTTIQSNEAYHDGGGIAVYGDGSAKVVNSTIFGNQAGNHGGGFFATGYTLLNIVNSTFAENTAVNGHEFMLGETRGVDFTNTIFVCNAASDICFVPAGNPISSTSSILGTGILQDYGLSEPADNGGSTQTMALLPGSPLIDAGNDTICADSLVNNLDQRGVTRPKGSHCDIGAYEYDGPGNSIDVSIGGSPAVSYPATPHQTRREGYAGINDGPVEITNPGSLSILAAERVIYKVKNVNTSFSEMMGLPNSQLDTIYWLPWYNNVDLDTQLRIANVTDQDATVTVKIGDMPQTPINLPAGESKRVSYPQVNAGPVEIVSTQNIVVAERVIYKVNKVNTSFSEMMALPGKQVGKLYWLPWYNNVDLDTQLRIANVTDQDATVTVTIGGVAQTPINLPAGESKRVSYPGANNGPVKIESDQNIVAAERVIYKVNKVGTSFSEMLALPDGKLSTTYWIPWYNNVDLDSQLRIANVSTSDATVTVTIGGQPQPSFDLKAGGSTRISYPNVNSGPVQIDSTQNIVAAVRVIYRVSKTPSSFSEMMGLPDGLIDSTYWFPWYNNVDLDTQLRFGMP